MTIVSLTLSLALTVLAVKLFISKKKDSIALSKREKLQKSTFFQLKFLKNSNLIELFSKSLKKLNLNVLNRKDYIYLPDDKTMVFLSFSFDGLSKTDIVKIANTSSTHIKVILTDEVYSETTRFAKHFDNLFIYSGEEVFKILEDSQNLPKIIVSPFPKKEKPSFRSFLDRKKAKTFLGFGLFFMISSFFVPFKIYYLIWGALMLVISLVSLLFGKEKVKG